MMHFDVTGGIGFQIELSLMVYQAAYSSAAFQKVMSRGGSQW